ncbi:MAG: hypothetical protein LKJ86_06785 [Oscillibacter sp.]|jgi:hypothetical protein|nr:hypothetical protein [Oscillibacter sp.]
MNVKESNLLFVKFSEKLSAGKTLSSRKTKRKERKSKAIQCYVNKITKKKRGIKAKRGDTIFLHYDIKALKIKKKLDVENHVENVNNSQ